MAAGTKEYISENTSYRKLAEKYKLPFGTLREVAKREKWTEIKAQIQHESNTKIIEIESNKQAQSTRASTVILSNTRTVL